MKESFQTSRHLFRFEAGSSGPRGKAFVQSGTSCLVAAQWEARRSLAIKNAHVDTYHHRCCILLWICGCDVLSEKKFVGHFSKSLISVYLHWQPFIVIINPSIIFTHSAFAEANSPKRWIVGGKEECCPTARYLPVTDVKNNTAFSHHWLPWSTWVKNSGVVFLCRPS